MNGNCIPAVAVAVVVTVVLMADFTCLYVYVCINVHAPSLSYLPPLFSSSLRCLQASVAFSDFSECHSVILTSGTLSPLDSFRWVINEGDGDGDG